MDDRVVDILQRIYDSEINYRIEAFWDGGWIAYLGDEANGFKACSNWCDSFEKMVIELVGLVRKYYPESEFSKWFRSNF